MWAEKSDLQHSYNETVRLLTYYYIIMELPCFSEEADLSWVFAFVQNQLWFCTKGGSCCYVPCGRKAEEDDCLNIFSLHSWTGLYRPVQPLPVLWLPPHGGPILRTGGRWSSYIILSACGSLRAQSSFLHRAVCSSHRVFSLNFRQIFSQ